MHRRNFTEGRGIRIPHFFGVGGWTPTPRQKFCLVPYFLDQSYATAQVDVVDVCYHNSVISTRASYEHVNFGQFVSWEIVIIIIISLITQLTKCNRDNEKTTNI